MDGFMKPAQAGARHAPPFARKREPSQVVPAATYGQTSTRPPRFAGDGWLAFRFHSLQHLSCEIVVALVISTPDAGDPLIVIGGHGLLDPYMRAATVP